MDKSISYMSTCGITSSGMRKRRPRTETTRETKEEREVMAKKRINVRLLRKVQKAILAHAAHFDMGEWGKGLRADEVLHDEPPESECGTVACIAGFTVLIEDGRTGDNVATRAAELLNLDYDYDRNDSTGDMLFLLSNWPTRFRARYRKAQRNITRARIAVERINHFIVTNGAE